MLFSDDQRDELHVTLPIFEGPLDLLLFLIRKDEVDIHDIPVERITKQYLEYLHLMEMLRLDIAGEFLVMAARLVLMKTVAMLPKEEQAQEEEIEDEADPRWELVRQLVEYRKFKEAAAQFQTMEIEREQLFPRGPAEPVEEEHEPEDLQGDVGIFDLLAAFQTVLDRANKEEDLREIFEDRWTVADKIKFLLEVVAARGRVRFYELFPEGATRTEVVVTFLAVLELIKIRKLRAVQAETFGEIDITGADDEPRPDRVLAEAAA